MTRPIAPSPKVLRLAHDLVERGPADPMAEELAGWLSGSTRFRAFAETHRDKIRKKLRNAAQPDALRDVRSELLAARMLLADRRMELAFEAYGSGKLGPDFTVTFRGARSFNLEVTRLRRVPSSTGYSAPLLAKLRQLPPSMPNAVLVAIEGDSADALDVAATALALRSRADAKDEAYFTDRGFDGTRGFYEHYLRLGAVLVWCEDAVSGVRASLWSNRSARIAMPESAARACLRCLSDRPGADP
jgi:hypothetical protein